MGQVLLRDRRFDEDDRIPSNPQSSIKKITTTVGGNIGDFTITQESGEKNDLNLKITRSRENSISNSINNDSGGCTKQHHQTNNTSVVITIRMLKMDPQQTETNTSCLCSSTTSCQCGGRGSGRTSGGSMTQTSTTPTTTTNVPSLLSSIQICDNNLELNIQKSSNSNYQNIQLLSSKQCSGSSSDGISNNSNGSSSNSSNINNNHHINLNNLNARTTQQQTTTSDNNNYNLMKNLTTTTTTAPTATNNFDKIKNNDDIGNFLVLKSGYTKKSIQHPNTLANMSTTTVNATSTPSPSTLFAIHDNNHSRKLTYLNVVEDENSNFSRQNMTPESSSSPTSSSQTNTITTNNNINNIAKMNNYEQHTLKPMPQSTNNNCINNNVMAAFNQLQITTSKPTGSQDYMCMNGVNNGAAGKPFSTPPVITATKRDIIETPGLGYTPMGIVDVDCGKKTIDGELSISFLILIKSNLIKLY